MATGLLDLAQRWLEECTTKDDVLEKIAIEHFLSKAPEDVRVWVREHKPKTCAEAGHWADEYQLARTDASGSQTTTPRSTPRRCHLCNQMGHLAHSCPRKLTRDGPVNAARQGVGAPRRPLPPLPPQPGTNKQVQCFSCGQPRHIAIHCRANAMFCEQTEDVFGADDMEGVVRQGLLEGVPVEVLLDTGSARTLVRSDLVPEGKVLEGKRIGVRCAHGDTAYYHIAELEVEIGGRTISIRAGVSERLPVQLLLGRDVPELLTLLASATSDSVETSVQQSESYSEQVVAVTTRAQARSVPRQVDQVVEKTAGDSEEEDLGKILADDLFEAGRERMRQTRSQKRNERRRYAIEKETTDGGYKWAPLEMSTEELKAAQQKDQTLAAARMVATGKPDLSEGEGFYYKDDVLYHRWERKGKGKRERARGSVSPVGATCQVSGGRAGDRT